MDEGDRNEDAGSRWDKRWAAKQEIRDPAAFIVEAGVHLPARGRALDIAGGDGRHALWLAGRGLEVTLVDVSAIALDRAAGEAASRGLTLDLVRRDLEAEGLPAGTWQVALMHHFFDPAVFASVPAVLEHDGVFVFCQPTVTNLEVHDRPGRRYLLQRGELAALVASMPLDLILLEEGWGLEGRHEARLIARRIAG